MLLLVAESVGVVNKLLIKLFDCSGEPNLLARSEEVRPCIRRRPCSAPGPLLFLPY